MQFFQPLFGFDQAGEVSPGTKIALAIGVFDGVHSGHREIIRTVCRMAEERSAVARALLPEAIDEGTKLKYEWLQYEIIE